MSTIIVLNGPNFELTWHAVSLKTYGYETLADVETMCREAALSLGHDVECPSIES